MTINLKKTYLFEIPIYRKTLDDYCLEQDKERIKLIEENKHRDDLQRINNWIDRQQKTWFFNDIIGWIQIYHEQGGKLKFNFYFVNTKRITKRLVKKVFELKGKGEFSELLILENSNEDIFNEINVHIDKIQKMKYTKYHIDKSKFIEIGKYVDFANLFKNF